VRQVAELVAATSRASGNLRRSHHLQQSRPLHGRSWLTDEVGDQGQRVLFGQRLHHDGVAEPGDATSSNRALLVTSTRLFGRTGSKFSTCAALAASSSTR